jgi:hypothetical protein
MPSEFTKLVGRREQEACVAFGREVGRLGFERTRKKFWVRLHEHTADVLHLHRGGISYGAPANASVSFRLHLGIRVLNDSFPAIALNGPDTDRAPREGRFHLRFNAESLDSFDRCVQDLARYVREVGEPWFARFRDVDTLLSDGDSPLQKDAKTCLRAALDGRSSDEAVTLTKKELGLHRRVVAPTATNAG